ncbi:MAG: DUF1343 domain-containing protein [Candidatus Aminicenantaceae bacterium]
MRGRGSFRSRIRPAAFFLAPLLFSFAAITQTPRSHQASPGARVKLGNESFVAQFPRELQDKRLGLVINHTAVLPDGTPLYRALLDKGVDVRAIFSPEHGFTGRIEGGEDVGDTGLEGIKIFSLYGKIRRPTPEQMAHIDALVYDIQDVGTRFYTYITTLKYVMEAAARAGLPVYVLDRPNPTGGTLVEGPLLDPKFESFIGALPIPIRYGLTCGELAAMMKGQGWVPGNVDLHLILMEGWQRHFCWQDTGLPWIATSPNIPTSDAAVAYPGTGLLGGVILNQGLGTEEPFLLWGAPWLDPEDVAGRLPPAVLEEVELESLVYTPRSIPGKSVDPPYKDRVCHGMRIHLQERSRFPSVRFSLELIRVLKEQYPEKIYQESNSLTLMFGTEDLARFLRGELAFSALMEGVNQDEELFLRQRRPYLLYK